MIEMTNRRLRAEPGRGHSVRLVFHLGNTLASAVDTQLAGLFDDLTGGTVYGGGTANVGGTLSWANIFYSQAVLRTKKVGAPYTCILHPVQWYYLTSASSGVPTLMQSEAIKDSVVGTFYQASFGGIDFYVDANITSGTAAVGAMFTRDAMVLDIRQPFKIEPQYFAKISGNGGWEIERVNGICLWRIPADSRRDLDGHVKLTTELMGKDRAYTSTSGTLHRFLALLEHKLEA